MQPLYEVTLLFRFLPRPRKRLRSIVMNTSVCLCVCLSARISQEPHADLNQIFVHVAYGRGSVLLRRRCDTLCTSGFVDDTMFFL